MDKSLILLAAGGTGGHLFPAEALAHVLLARGHDVHLVTDSRAERFAGHFPASAIHVVPSATFGSKNPVAIVRTLWKLWSGTRKARALMGRIKPKVVVGFGGYPTIPPLMAATGIGIPSMIHEQNAVMGRANKALASRVSAIAGGFLPQTASSKVVTTGNPVRPAVIEASSTPYSPSRSGELFNLLVFGGSQGAQFFSSAIPDAIEKLPPDLKARLRVTQQARPEDRDLVATRYERMGIVAGISPFFTDMAARIASAHLVICRSGASTVSELAVIGRPSILVPYPYALDHDQAANAAALKAAGGADVIAQSELSPDRLAALISKAMAEPDRLAGIAAAAKATGKPHAADLLADMVEAIGSGQSIEAFRRQRA